jgi:hypothetical protein
VGKFDKNALISAVIFGSIFLLFARVFISLKQDLTIGFSGQFSYDILIVSSGKKDPNCLHLNCIFHPTGKVHQTS